MNDELLVIGGGIAGMSAAKLAAELGAKVVLAEPDRLGGTCLNRGCIPKKALVRAAQLYALAQGLAEFGITTGEVHIDWEKAVARKDRLVEHYLGTKADALRERKIDWLREPVRFLDRHTVQAGGRTLAVGKVILASGSMPLTPPIPGVEHTIDSVELLALKRIPPRLIVIGGGVIAMEFASMFGHVGSKVTVLEAMPTILTGVEADLRAGIEAAAPGWGVALHTGAKVTRVQRVNGHLAVTTEVGGDERRFEAEVVLLATGRGPRVDGLDLDKIGVTLEKSGVKVNDYLETDAPGIYAVGDVHGRFQLSPVADHEARLAVNNALGGNQEKADYRVVPRSIFTIPSASSVGLGEAEARAQGIDVSTSTVAFGSMGPAVIVGKSEGFVKLVFEQRRGELLGGHIFGSESEELIHQVVIAMEARMTRDQLLKAIPIHPSLSEAFFGAARSARTG